MSVQSLLTKDIHTDWKLGPSTVGRWWRRTGDRHAVCIRVLHCTPPETNTAKVNGTTTRNPRRRAIDFGLVCPKRAPRGRLSKYLQGMSSGVSILSVRTELDLKPTVAEPRSATPLVLPSHCSLSIARPPRTPCSAPGRPSQPAGESATCEGQGSEGEGTG